ncbi:hypothetical protein EXIGLDRAFT_760321 [Exidia glandulosa HHB12029]|uniref:TMEM205-like domain-containing protein n=1 Tax=Exidia glandulosa HHB12029 TaxID=1314781 RepID=A0A165PFK1_EXIGL|nr:hypothetical protein EXIGLDRAFT_760321 [Exidia glandulosa HHB12029]
MGRTDTLSLSGLFLNPAGVYILSYGWLFGQTIWVSFIGGVIAHRSLTRQQFAALQSKSFPAYFSSSTVLSSLMIALWSFSHPDVLSNLAKPGLVDVLQVYVLAFVALVQGANYTYIGPVTNKIIADRQRLEREEGKAYNDPTASAAMKAVNKQFGTFHGISSLLNLFVVIALGFHGLVLGQYGFRSY